jgi:peptidase E
VQPLYLLADSQLLFWKDARHDRSPILDALRCGGGAPSPHAAYVGASNGDAPEYYEIFESAMAALGVTDCPMIPSAFSPEDERRLAQADIILLAGGDVERGWTVMCETGLRDHMIRRYRDGATLIGVSAGAVQLGLYGVSEHSDSARQPFQTFQFCPFVVGAHDERSDWRDLTDLVRSLDAHPPGLGIRTGAGVIAHADGTIEAIRHPADELVWNDGDIARRLVMTRGDRGVPTTG